MPRTKKRLPPCCIFSTTEIKSPGRTSRLPNPAAPDELFHRYPDTPMPPMAGGDHGMAPMFAASVTYDDDTETWTGRDSVFDTAGGMWLANEMMWFHNDEVDGYPTL